MHRATRAISAATVTLLALASAAPAGAKTPPRPKHLDAGAKEACAEIPYAISDIQSTSSGSIADQELDAAFDAVSLATVTDGLKVSAQVPERYFDAIKAASTNNGKLAALRNLKKWCGDAAKTSRATKRRHKRLTQQQLAAQQGDQLLNAGLEAEVTGDNATAVKKFKQLLTIDPNNKFALYNLGYIAQTVDQDNAAAAKYYERAIKTDPNYGPALYNLGVLETDRGNKARAIDLYLRAIEADPADANAALNVGFLIAETGDTARAKEYFRRAVSLNPALIQRIPYGQRP